MENAEILRPENPTQSNRTAAPLFARTTVPPITENPPSRISNQNLLLPISEEPQKIPDPSSQLTLPANTNLPAAENVEPEQRENSELSRDENQASFGAEKTVIPPQRKPRRKPPVKKVRSQKRTAVPLKLFVSPAEKEDLGIRARERNCSLSNYIRLNLGLAPNEAGRKKQNVVAAFDLSELELDLD